MLAYRNLSICHYTRSEALDLVYCGLRGLNCAERLGSSEELAEALAIISVIAMAARRRQLAEAYAARANSLLPLVTDPARRANLLFVLAVYRSIRCEWGEAIAVQEQVISLAESVSNWRLLQNGSFGLARASMRWGRLELGHQHFERLEQLGRRVDSGQATAWGLSGMLQSQFGAQPEHWEQRLSALRTLLHTEAGRDHLTPADYALCSGSSALTLQRLGRLEEAEAEALKTGDIALSTDAVATHMIDPLAWAADIHLECWKRFGDADGRRRKRIERLDGALQRFASKYGFAPPIAWRTRGELLCLQGRLRKGCAALQAALAAAGSQSMPCEAARALHALAEHAPPAARVHYRAQAHAAYEQLGMQANLAALNALG